MEEKLIYKGIIFDLVQKDVKIKDKMYKRDIIRHPGGVGVICIIDGKILRKTRAPCHWKRNA